MPLHPATSHSSQHQLEKSAEGLAPAVRLSITECNIKMHDLTVPSASGITASAPWGSPSLAADPHRLDMPLPSSGRGGWMDAGMIYSHWVSESPPSYEAMKYTVEAETVAASGGEDYPTNLLRGMRSKCKLENPVVSLHLFKLILESCWALFQYVLRTWPRQPSVLFWVLGVKLSAA